VAISRRILGHLAILAAVAMSGYSAYLAARSYAEWRKWRISDPSAAELYQIDIWWESALCLGGLIAAALVAYWIRPSRRRPLQ
jgi:hypothetical protein